ncbi:hypothetical protein BH11BAC3_BH11BAC3_26130 [soil metagenome]
MKLSIVSLMVLLISCTGTEKKAGIDMSGAYMMLSVEIKSDSSDSTYTNTEQAKIYNGDYMMYANYSIPDSSSSFGIATYNTNGDTLTENVFYRSADSIVTDKTESYNLLIEKTGTGFKQVIKAMPTNTGVKIDLTEIYDSVGNKTTSALDGAWKMTNRYIIKGTDTTAAMATQYKMYYAGYCIWGHTWKDSGNKTYTGMGYGTFTMPSANKVKESMIASTYGEVKGHDFDITIEMMGNEGFKQMMDNSDSTKSVEIYERLKK